MRAYPKYRYASFVASSEACDSAEEVKTKFGITLADYGRFSLRLLNFASAHNLRSHETQLRCGDSLLSLPTLSDMDGSYNRRVSFRVPDNLYEQTLQNATEQNLSFNERARRSYNFAHFLVTALGSENLIFNSIEFKCRDGASHGLLLMPDLSIAPRAVKN